MQSSLQWEMKKDKDTSYCELHLSSDGQVVYFFRITLVVTLISLPCGVLGQSSFFYQRIPVVHLEDDIVDVYEVTPGMEMRHINQRQPNSRNSLRPHPTNHPEVNNLISMLLTPSESHESWDHSLQRRPPSSSFYRRSFGRMVAGRWPDGLIPFVIDRPLREYPSIPRKR